MDSLIKIAQEFYIGEINDKILYTELANLIFDKELKENILKIAKTEEKHANFWQKFIISRGGQLPKEKIDRKKLFLLKFLSKFINPIIFIYLAEIGEDSAVKKYYDFYKNAGLTEYERSSLKNIISDEIEHETYFLNQAENLGLSNVRDLILGINDGLVEILGAVAGLTAVYTTNPQIIGISGIVVGLAGALSMGIGAYLSVKSQKQINIHINERNGILLNTNVEKSYELFEEKLKEDNIPQEAIKEIINVLREKKVNLSSIFIKEIEENEIKSGVLTGFAYLLGTIFPITPFFIFSNSYYALTASFFLALLVLSMVGVFVALFSGISIKRKVLEMIIASLSAAAISFSFGKILQHFFNVKI